MKSECYCNLQIMLEMLTYFLPLRDGNFNLGHRCNLFAFFFFLLPIEPTDKKNGEVIVYLGSKIWDSGIFCPTINSFFAFFVIQSK
jgi:hypothetical protein